jgi:two-component system chemotaxis response regulator CheB
MNIVPSAVVTPRGTARTGGKIRVLIVDDSLVIRHLIDRALSDDPEIEVVGAEADGAAALARIPVLKPDLITLDIEMPVMNGLDALREIRKLYPRLRVVMFSTLTTRGASATLEALSLGADDYVTKAANAGSLDQSLAALRCELIPKVKQFFHRAEPVAVRPVRPVSITPAARPTHKICVLAIAVSTGGPQALAELMPQLPAALPIPVLIVQHMPAMFTRLLAERLQTICPLEVAEAQEGMELQAGRVILAQGDYHLTVRRRGHSVVAALNQQAPVSYCRPSADVMFHSLAEQYGGEVLSLVLTGMGSDGLDGTKALKSRGAYCLAQDEQSSTVWGMPGAVVRAGLADQVLPLSEIAPVIVRLVRG